MHTVQAKRMSAQAVAVQLTADDLHRGAVVRARVARLDEEAAEGATNVQSVRGGLGCGEDADRRLGGEHGERLRLVARSRHDLDELVGDLPG